MLLQRRVRLRKWERLEFQQPEREQEWQRHRQRKCEPDGDAKRANWDGHVERKQSQPHGEREPNEVGDARGDGNADGDRHTDGDECEWERQCDADGCDGKRDGEQEWERGQRKPQCDSEPHQDAKQMDSKYKRNVDEWHGGDTDAEWNGKREWYTKRKCGQLERKRNADGKPDGERSGHGEPHR